MALWIMAKIGIVIVLVMWIAFMVWVTLAEIKGKKSKPHINKRYKKINFDHYEEDPNGEWCFVGDRFIKLPITDKNNQENKEAKDNDT